MAKTQEHGAFTPSEIDLEKLGRALAKWFGAHARDLSFRATRDPYAIWVSEIMAQQTQIATVERYFRGFMARFPTVKDLAQAREDDVLAAWSGLGYYRRARLLHRGAQHVASELHGRIPASAEALREIPGIGPYTAGAISSIAFDQPSPLVDGNVARVVSRLRGLREPGEQDAKSKAHWEFVAKLLRVESPRILAQALMELGALVCTPRTPACEQCPLRSQCSAYATQSTGQIPSPKVRAQSPVEMWWAIVIVCRQQVWMQQRPSTGLLAGMWTPPLLSRTPKERKPSTRALAKIVEGFGAKEVAIGNDVRHVFSHRIWEVRVATLRSSQKPKTTGDGVWYESGGEIPGGIPSLTKKVLG
jgi:A/G-specific adenine glycosylase